MTNTKKKKKKSTTTSKKRTKKKAKRFVKNKSSRKTEVTYIRLTEDLHQWVTSLAKSNGLDGSKVIRLILEQAKEDGVVFES